MGLSKLLAQMEKKLIDEGNKIVNLQSKLNQTINEKEMFKKRWTEVTKKVQKNDLSRAKNMFLNSKSKDDLA